jgi:hypothetical protein
MTGVEYLAGKILGGAAKGTASTLLKHRLEDNSKQKSPVSKPEDCFWGADNQLYCPVNTLPNQQNRTQFDRSQGFNADPQPNVSPTEFKPMDDRPWETETFTRELDDREIDLDLSSEDSKISEPFRTSTV